MAPWLPSMQYARRRIQYQCIKVQNKSVNLYTRTKYLIIRNFLFSESGCWAKTPKRKKLKNSQIHKFFVGEKSGNMSQAALSLPHRGDARFGTKSRVCNRTDGAPSRIDYQSTLMPTGAHSFKLEVVHTRRAPRACAARLAARRHRHRNVSRWRDPHLLAPTHWPPGRRAVRYEITRVQ